MTIRTNNHWRPILNWYELTEKEQESLKDSYESIQESSFFRYRGQVYDLSDFMRSSHETGFDGIHSDSAFSAVAINLSECGESVKVSRLYS